MPSNVEARPVYELRPYQSTAVNETLASLQQNPVVVAPTGAGKTVVGTEIVRRFLADNHDLNRILWLAHRQELIEQAAKRLNAVGLQTGIIMAGHRPCPGAPVQVASVQTLRRQFPPIVSLIIVDEAHHANAVSYADILNVASCPRIGLTATPFRLDGKGLGDVFGKIIVAAHTDELCKAGTLHAPKIFACHSPDLRGVKTVGGEYVGSALAARVNTAENRADIVKEWMRLTPGKKTVCFAIDVEHSKAIVEAFVKSGVKAEHIDGETPKQTRSDILARLASGDIDIVSNCMILTEGWDLPSLEVAIIARPTASLNLHWQMIGRIMRAADGKDQAVVLDHAGNHFRHGTVTRRIEFSLDAAAKHGEAEPLGLKRCPSCMYLMEPTEKTCPECGHVFVTKSRDAHIDGDSQLVEVVTDWNYKVELFRQFAAQAEATGYNPVWAKYKYKEVIGEWPVVVNGDLIDPETATIDQKEAYYRDLLIVAKEKGFADGWASHQYKGAFSCWPTRFVSKVKAQLADLPQYVPDPVPAPTRPAWKPKSLSKTTSSEPSAPAPICGSGAPTCLPPASVTTSSPPASRGKPTSRASCRTAAA
jgi:superfamily II DNA or RNA helicase